MWGGCRVPVLCHRGIERFIPTHVGRMAKEEQIKSQIIRFIPTHVGRMKKTDMVKAEERFIPTHVGRMDGRLYICRQAVGSSPRTWGGFQQAHF